MILNQHLKDKSIAILGLGYVGLPLLIEFSKFFDVFGFDINDQRINQLQSGEDVTLETNSDDLKMINKNRFTSDINDIKESNIYIVTVPTPINKYNQTDLS